MRHFYPNFERVTAFALLLRALWDSAHPHLQLFEYFDSCNLGTRRVQLAVSTRILVRSHLSFLLEAGAILKPS